MGTARRYRDRPDASAIGARCLAASRLHKTDVSALAPISLRSPTKSPARGLADGRRLSPRLQVRLSVFSPNQGVK